MSWRGSTGSTELPPSMTIHHESHHHHHHYHGCPTLGDPLPPWEPYTILPPPQRGRYYLPGAHTPPSLLRGAQTSFHPFLGGPLPLWCPYSILSSPGPLSSHILFTVSSYSFSSHTIHNYHPPHHYFPILFLFTLPFPRIPLNSHLFLFFLFTV